MRRTRGPMTCLFAGSTLAGGTQTSSPVAIGQRNDLDSLAHGAPSYAATPVSARDPALVSERRF